ncbi:MAG: protein-export chaperone SecB [Selenomonadaceae bacterium]|nr:protein-export chaperone SecB [Selenomonadaceae bacterium]
MEESREKIYKEYKLSRDSIQLVDVFVTQCAAEAVVDLDDPNFYDDVPVNDLRLNHSYEWINDTVAKGYLVAKIDVLSSTAKQTIAQFSIKVVGVFKITTGENVAKNEFVRRLELQIVPQLLPYVRSALTSLSALLTLPPVTLPTMDVLLSIKKNGQA